VSETFLGKAFVAELAAQKPFVVHETAVLVRPNHPASPPFSLTALARPSVVIAGERAAAAASAAVTFAAAAPSAHASELGEVRASQFDTHRMVIERQLPGGGCWRAPRTCPAGTGACDLKALINRALYRSRLCFRRRSHPCACPAASGDVGSERAALPDKRRQQPCRCFLSPGRCFGENANAIAKVPQTPTHSCACAV
jgi:hypothetical protein